MGHEHDEQQHVHVHLHFEGAININLQHGGQGPTLDQIAELITQLERTMTAQFDALKTEVERSTTVAESAVKLIQGLADQIEALKDDPVALQALVDQLRANDDSVAAAVTANTPTP